MTSRDSGNTRGLTPREAGNLLTRLISAVGRYIHLETNDGIRREGRLSGWNGFTVRVNGKDLVMPLELELNGDIQDVVSLQNLRWLTIDAPASQDE